jgi:hypothetical protein
MTNTKAYTMEPDYIRNYRITIGYWDTYSIWQPGSSYNLDSGFEPLTGGGKIIEWIKTFDDGNQIIWVKSGEGYVYTIEDKINPMFVNQEPDSNFQLNNITEIFKVSYLISDYIL